MALELAKKGLIGLLGLVLELSPIKSFAEELPMAGQVTIAEVRKTMETQLERLGKLREDVQSAAPAKRGDLNSQIDIIAQDIRNLDTMLQGLIEPCR